MYKQLLVAAALVVALSNVAGLTTIAAVSVSAENANSSKADDKKDKDSKKDDEATAPPVVIPAPFPLNIPPFTLPITPTPAANVADDKKDEKVKKEKAPKEEKGDKKITICHRTNAPKNPYRLITVSKKAVDGEAKNDHTHHTGPIATSLAVAKALKAAGTKWGDIIPQEGDYPGKAIFDNGCKYTTVSPTPSASIDSDVVCDVPNQRAKITLTNTGAAAGSAIVNGTTVVVAANDETITYIPTLAGKLQIVVSIDGAIDHDKELDCRTGGQGGVVNPLPITPTTPTTPSPVVSTLASTPAVSAGQGSVNTADAAAIASLPYTAGNSTQLIALIVTAIIALIAIVSTIAKKAYLKQI